MHREVATEAWIDYRVMLATVGVGRVDGLHAHVQAHDEIVEIKAQTKAVGHGYLLVELIELELSARLVLIVLDSPNIARSTKKAPLNFQNR